MHDNPETPAHPQLCGNLFTVADTDRTEPELVSILAENKTTRIERIVSRGHCSASGFWYDQEQDEFVVVLKGSAGLRYENREELVIMGPGDYVLIPAHCRHRVEWTDRDGGTVWLAVHMDGNGERCSGNARQTV